MNDDIELLRDAVRAMEVGDEQRVKELPQTLNDKRFENLFAEIGRLTRDIHDEIRDLISDRRIQDLTDLDITNCHERLNYAMAQTEQAANLALDEVEAMLPRTASIAKSAGAVFAECASGKDTLESLEGFAQQVQQI